MIQIKDLMKWEQLTKIPFSKMDYNNSEHMEALLYVRHIKGNGRTLMFEDFKRIDLYAKSKQKEFESLARELQFNLQYHPAPSSEEPTAEELEDAPSVYIEEVVNELMLNGISANYLLESTSEIIPSLIAVLDKKKREEMENSRLWTYISILPHIDSKKIKSPTDLLPFPWEVEEAKIEREKEHKEALTYAQGFLKV